MFSYIFAKKKFSEAAAWEARVATIIKCVIQALAKMVPQEMANEFIINAKVLYFTDVLKRRRQVCDFLGSDDFIRFPKACENVDFC